MPGSEPSPRRRATRLPRPGAGGLVPRRVGGVYHEVAAEEVDGLLAEGLPVHHAEPLSGVWRSLSTALILANAGGEKPSPVAPPRRPVRSGLRGTPHARPRRRRRPRATGRRPAPRWEARRRG